MKKVVLTICILCLGLVTALAQPSSQNTIPKTMSYQAIIRNGSQGLVSNGNITVRISIIKGSEFGSPAFVETHNSKTNSNGLVTLEIGGGIPLFGSFQNIDWSNGPYFIRTETDPLGGTEYGITSISPILTIPYAMHALRALNADSVKVEKDPVFSRSIAAGITSDDTAKWNGKISMELDPVFGGSAAAGIELSDIAKWDSAIVKETDPIFKASPASTITDTMVKRWDSSIVVEKDPLFIAWDKDYDDLINKPITDGSETKIQAGRNISISGKGKIDSAYTISYSPSTLKYIMVGDSYSISEQITVALITSNNNSTTDAISLPTGIDGQIMYVIHIGNDSLSIDGTIFITEKKFTYIYANGWHLMSTK
jgi:hypothetical protein